MNPSYGGRSSYSFDNTAVAMLTLFEVASLELWLDVMYTAADVRGVGLAPVRDSNPVAVFFFMAFIMLASFFILNLFVSVVAENFAKMKQKMDNNAMFMTESQRRWADLQRDLAGKKPAKLHAPLPNSSAVRVWAFKVVDNSRFELTILTLILLNVVMMATRSRDQPEWWDTALYVLNQIFGVAFLAEACLKLLGLGKTQYFSSYAVCACFLFQSTAAPSLPCCFTVCAGNGTCLTFPLSVSMSLLSSWKSPLARLPVWTLRFFERSV